MNPFKRITRLLIVVGSMALLSGTFFAAQGWAASPSTPAANPPVETPAFVQAAAQAGMLEIDSARLAINASSNPAVKSFAARMMADHEQVGADLAKVAGAKGMVMPDALSVDGAKQLASLRSKAAKEFDAAYAQQMLEDHAAVIALFQANVASPDGEIAAFVGRTLPVLQQHHRLAENLKANLKSGSRGAASPDARAP